MEITDLLLSVLFIIVGVFFLGNILKVETFKIQTIYFQPCVIGVRLRDGD